MQNGTYGGVFFAYCYNLYVHNATFYYNFTQNPWYQATVTGISANSQVWNITVSPQPAYSCAYRLQGILTSRYLRAHMRHACVRIGSLACHGLMVRVNHSMNDSVMCERWTMNCMLHALSTQTVYSGDM